MVFYFHTKYARDDLKYLVAVHPDYKQYDESELGEKDKLIIGVYLNLTALAEFINLMQIFTKSRKVYNTLYAARFQYIDMNIDDDAGASRVTKKYIYHSDIKSLLERKNTRLLLYNSWYTRDLYRCQRPDVRHCNVHCNDISHFFFGKVGLTH